MLKIGTGWSEDSDTAEATQDALKLAQDQLGGQPAKAAMVFAGIDMDLEVLTRELAEALPGVPVAGCTTDGEVAGPEGFLEDSVVITLFASDAVDFTVGMGAGATGTPAQATADAVNMAKAASDKAPALCIALPEGLGTNIHHLLNGLRDQLGEDFPIVGGAAGDQLRFQGTKQFMNQTIVNDAMVVLMMHGPVIYSCGVATGYEPLGNRHTITKAEGATVYEIDDRPAADLYADYLQQPSIFYPLAVYEEKRQSFVLSSPLNFDEETGAIQLVNPVENAARVQLATATRDEIVDAARTAVQSAYAGFPSNRTPDLALFFSCAGRRATLGTRTAEEYESIADIVGEDIPTSGFYTYGEIGPDQPQGRSVTHTNAFLAVLLGTQETV
ncbi:FIST signal transduction protein [Pseudooctadecabacter sp.]|uniref:FIST signal transduction protein n=1 Tax=Pseudooctadecabacter sp. TaxID=1966338 RepID=UPI0035C878D1